MSKKKRQAPQKIANLAVSVLILAIFIIPTFLTAKWLVGIVSHKDPRKVVAAAELKRRSIDKNNDLKPFDEPIVSVAFDDGWESVYTDALPVLQRYGIPTTQYIITSTFKNPSYMSIEQIRSMKNAGHEIASHSISHPNLTNLTEEEIKEELYKSRFELEKQFGPIYDFTSPYGAYNTYTLNMIGKYYRSQKNAEGDPEADPLLSINIKGRFNPRNMRSYSVRASTTPDEIRTLIKAAQENNAWLILTYHQIDWSGETFSVTPEDFEEQMLLLNTSDIKVATIGDVLKVALPNYKREL